MVVLEDKPYVAYGDNVTVLCTQQNRPVRRSPLGGHRQCIYDPRPDRPDYWLSGPPADCPLVECGPPPALAGQLRGAELSVIVGWSCCRQYSGP